MECVSSVYSTNPGTPKQNETDDGELNSRCLLNRHNQNLDKKNFSQRPVETIRPINNTLPGADLLGTDSGDLNRLWRAGQLLEVGDPAIGPAREVLALRRRERGTNGRQ